MNLKKIIAVIIIFSMVMIYGCVYATNTTQSNQNMSMSTNNNISEEYLNQEIEFTSFVEVKQGTTVKEFIQQERERRLKEWYSDKVSEGYTVEFGNAVVWAINGTTNRDEIYNKIKLGDSDLIRTNVEIEIGVTFSKDGAPGIGIGEGELVGVVVPGDLTGTGEIDVTDASTIQEELVETTQLKGLYKKAADMDHSGKVDIVDLSQLQEYIVNN